MLKEEGQADHVLSGMENIPAGNFAESMYMTTGET